MNIDELKALEKMASPGPWGLGECRSKEDINLYIAMRNELPELISRLEAAEAERDVLASKVDWCPPVSGHCDSAKCAECRLIWAAQEAAKN